MNNPLVVCPVCGRDVALWDGATNLKGEPVMMFHYRDCWKKCEGANLSVAAAKKVGSK